MNIIKGSVKDVKFWPDDRKLWEWMLLNLNNKEVEITIKRWTKKRTGRQNRSLHKLLSDTSEVCLEKGIDMRSIVKDNVPIQCTPENLKWLWRLLQEALFGTKSTTELKKTGEIDIVYDNFNKILIERTNGEISLPPWPSIEELITQERILY